MPNRKVAYGILATLLVLSLILGVLTLYSAKSRSLEVIFFDVGQGDAVLISQGNNQLLIDGGRNGKLILEKLGRHVPFWDRTIEVVMATHPDQDHIGGLIDVAKTYNISAVLETGAQSDSQTFKSWEELINNGKIEKINAGRGMTVSFPHNEIKAEIIYPPLSIDFSDKSSANQYSVVIRLKSGEDSFLFTGDFPQEQELALIRDPLALNSRVNLNSRVLKVAHHGSKYSTSEEFIKAVNPKEAIISAGKNNSYGHPAPETLDRLLKNGIKMFRTDEMGDIIYKCENQDAKCKIIFE